MVIDKILIPHIILNCDRLQVCLILNINNVFIDIIMYLKHFFNLGHTCNYVWMDNDIKSSRQAFLGGLSSGLKNPQKGKRLIITHIGNEDGFLEGADWVFEAKKSDGDYHGEMDAHNFEKW